ncbi:trypsin-like peptidase domain-containing protein [Streptomyces sp. NPDC020362]|uniref:S1C family serine protease n=1 Tax=unclassified Streptomyces TaxID=2593676 RepID=UPI0033FA71C5
MNEGNPTQVPPGEHEDRAPAGEAQPSPTGTTVPLTDGDFELAKPAPAVPAPAMPDAGVTDAVVAETAGAETEVADAGVADAGVARSGADPVEAGAPGASVGERPKPLHDPDPYGTPPYGEPGPWAPAPPVQHPAAAPAQGTAAAAPATAQTPAQTAPHAPVHSAPPPHAPTATPASAPAPVSTPAPVSAPAPTAAPAPASVPAAASAPAPTAMPAPGSAPEPAASSAALPPGAPDTAPPAPGSASEPAASSAALPPGAPDTALPAADAGAVPLLGPAGPAGHPGDPWQRYDPWVAPGAERQHPVPGPLQQTGAAVLTEQQRRRRAKRMLLVWTLLVAVFSGGIGGIVGAYVERDGVGDVHLPQAGKVPAGRAPDSVAGIAARALPSVVTLHVRGADEAGTGTGFVLDTRGHILTNNHVVQPAGSGGEISVSFSSGDTAKARVVGRDSGYDLAVVQVSGVRGLTPMPLGNSDDVQVGDPVVAIGAPFDLANTVTSGIISAKERPITAGGEKGDGSDVSYVDALQTDAPINPGNSGGPLLDSRAQAIGINSAIRSADTESDSEDGQAGSIGLGFAIPINQAKRVAEELINTGRATHPVIGVNLDMGYTGDGARIDTKASNGGPAVIKGGPGERAGLRAGDVITEVDGQRVHSGEELIVKIRAHRPGDRLRLTVEHGAEREVSLVLGASEQN